MKDTHTDRCPGVPGSTVQFIVDTDPVAGTPIYGVNSSSRMHVLIVDVNGRTVIIHADGPDSDPGFVAAMDPVEPLIDSFRSAPAN